MNVEWVSGSYVLCPYCDPNHVAYPNLEASAKIQYESFILFGFRAGTQEEEKIKGGVGENMKYILEGGK